MEDTENRLISEPVPIGSDRLEGHICKYAEKSYMYKYDLGNILLKCVVIVAVEELYRACNRARERERGRCLHFVTAAACGEEEDKRSLPLCFLRLCIPLR